MTSQSKLIERDEPRCCMEEFQIAKESKKPKANDMRTLIEIIKHRLNNRDRYKSNF